MSFLRRLSCSAACAFVLSGLAACGGGTGSATSVLRDALSSALSALTSSSALAGIPLQDLFDLKFLDSGSTRLDIQAALAAEASVLQSDAEYSGVPQATLSNLEVSDCKTVNGQSDVCTLSATLTNSDADTTSVNFTTLVRYSEGRLRLLGDQLAGDN